MFFLKRKKEKSVSETLNISSIQLLNILQNAILLAKEDINARSYTVGPEIMFEYNNVIHFIGVKYEKKQAKVSKRNEFCEKFMQVYLNKQNYPSPELLFEKADINGELFKNIASGILVSSDYKKMI